MILNVYNLVGENWLKIGARSLSIKSSISHVHWGTFKKPGLSFLFDEKICRKLYKDVVGYRYVTVCEQPNRSFAQIFSHKLCTRISAEHHGVSYGQLNYFLSERIFHIFHREMIFLACAFVNGLWEPFYFSIGSHKIHILIFLKFPFLESVLDLPFWRNLG